LEAVAGLPAVRLLLVGRGQLETRLRKRAAAPDLQGRVEFAGWVPSEAMPGLYRRMDVLVLPSRTTPNWKEQFGRVLIDAMASGVAVVGSDSGEIPHVIADAGLVFPEGDVAALRERLARLLADPALRQELGRRGRARVLEHYTQARVAQAYLEVYRSITL
jgi:glycosyltransferase involved in cell wall biosynthesis